MESVILRSVSSISILHSFLYKYFLKILTRWQYYFKAINRGCQLAYIYDHRVLPLVKRYLLLNYFLAQLVGCFNSCGGSLLQVDKGGQLSIGRAGVKANNEVNTAKINRFNIGIKILPVIIHLL